VVIHTNDGGERWEVLMKGDIQFSPKFYAVCFIDNERGWIGGMTLDTKGIILHTSDGGESWKTVLKTEGRIRGMCYTGGDSIIAVGAGLILKYTDPSLKQMISVQPMGKQRLTWGEMKREGKVRSFELDLLQNYPNPFNLETWIPFKLSKPSDVVIRIYDVKGRIVKEIRVEAEGAGLHAVRWDGRDGRGEEVSSGTYFYSLEAGRFKAVRKMTVIK